MTLRDACLLSSLLLLAGLTACQEADAPDIEESSTAICGASGEVWCYTIDDMTFEQVGTATVTRRADGLGWAIRLEEALDGTCSTAGRGAGFDLLFGDEPSPGSYRVGADVAAVLTFEDGRQLDAVGGVIAIDSIDPLCTSGQFELDFGDGATAGAGFAALRCE